ncbi:response regulator [Planctomycetota bacterium]
MREACPVLVIDNDAKFRRLAKEALVHPALFVIQAEDGPEGIEKARAKRPRLVVIEVMLPDMDGLEVFRSIKRELGLKECRYVLVSATAPKGALGLARDAGVYATLKKPFTGGVLRRTALRALRMTEDIGDETAAAHRESLMRWIQAEAARSGVRRKMDLSGPDTVDIVPGEETVDELPPDTDKPLDGTEKVAETLRPGPAGAAEFRQRHPGGTAWINEGEPAEDSEPHLEKTVRVGDEEPAEDSEPHLETTVRVGDEEPAEDSEPHLEKTGSVVEGEPVEDGDPLLRETAPVLEGDGAPPPGGQPPGEADSRADDVCAEETTRIGDEPCTEAAHLELDELQALDGVSPVDSCDSDPEQTHRLGD